MSSLYKRNTIYWLSFRENGKGKCKSLHTEDRSTAIYLKAQHDQEQAHGHLSVPDADSPCRPALEKYLSFHEHRRTRLFNSMSRSRIDKFLAWGRIDRFTKITENRLQEYLNYRMQTVSSYEANNTITALKAWLNWCVRSRILFSSPLLGIKKLKTPEATRRFLTKKQIKTVLDVAADPKIYADRKPVLLPYIATAIYAGLRKAELNTLEWTDIDFDRNIIHVNNKTDFTTKSKRNRSVPLHPALRRILLPLRKKAGRCFDSTNARRVFGRIMRKAHLEDFNLHEMRHTFASQSLMAGVPVPTVSKWLGHASLTTTQIYSHLSKTHEQEEIKRLHF